MAAFPITGNIALIKNYYLKGVLAIYVIAFASLYVQVQPLFGDSGVAPVADLVAKMQAPKTASLDAYNIVLMAPKLGLSYATFIELICFIGVLLALACLVTKRLANALSFALLWYAYYSIRALGQGFISFHSDLMLLEVGFITILLAPLLPTAKPSQSDHDHLTFFLIKWLTFRYFVTNVFNVYLDNDKAWYSMTAIPMVAQGVQFPSLFSWHVYNMPAEYVKLYQAYEHTVKLCAPFLMMLDLKFTRMLGFYTLLFIAVPQALFFNFGWTDLLIAVCLLTYLKDHYFYTDKRARQSTARTFFDMAFVMAYLAVVVGLLVRFFGVKLANGQLSTQVMFTPAQVKLVVDHMIPIALVFGIIGLLNAARETYFNSKRKTSLIKNLAYTVVVFALFFSTFPTLTRFSPTLETRIKPLSITKDLNKLAGSYMLSNNYLVLSKVSQHYADGRPELHIQARASSEEPVWQQYEFKYKLGHPLNELIRVLPHMPRIELKMWYAARSSIQSNQWLQTLAYRLATNEKVFAGSLMSPLGSTKAGQVRVVVNNCKYSQKNKIPFAGYWAQTKMVSEYMPATGIENLKFAVKSSGVSLSAPSKPSSAGTSKAQSFDKMLNQYLEISSEYIRGVDQTTVIWSLATVASAVAMLR